MITLVPVPDAGGETLGQIGGTSRAERIAFRG